jgi:co-chaperonin GroES (HSP10)
MKLLSNRILLTTVKEEVKSDSGIMLSSGEVNYYDNTYRKGQVQKVGDGKTENGIVTPTTVKVGDVVLYAGGQECVIGGEKFVLITEDQVIAYEAN